MRRTWTAAHLEPEAGGIGLRLDGRAVRTPGNRALVLPTQALAEAVAAEWAAQGERIDPMTMPLTRAANSAIDRVVPAPGPVAAMLAGFAETDLTCYRAPHPPGLAARQAAAWDPLLDWAAAALAARLIPVEGVMFVAQDTEAVVRLGRAVAAHGAWELTALHDLVTLTGSLVIGLALSHGRLGEEEGWMASRIDEDWNIEQWGEDADAARRAAFGRAEFAGAMRLLALLRMR